MPLKCTGAGQQQDGYETESDTGLPTFEILKETFDFVAPHSTRRSSLTETEIGN